jgi:hypothetical protein
VSDVGMSTAAWLEASERHRAAVRITEESARADRAHESALEAGRQRQDAWDKLRWCEAEKEAFEKALRGMGLLALRVTRHYGLVGEPGDDLRSLGNDSEILRRDIVNLARFVEETREVLDPTPPRIRWRLADHEEER